MKMKQILVLCSVLGLLGIVPAASSAQTLQQNADNLNIGFSTTGFVGLTPDTILPYFSTFYTATTNYYSANNLTLPGTPAGTSICEAYVSADVALAPSGKYGTVNDVGSRAWFEDWLHQLSVAQQTNPHTCDHVLVVFKMFPAAGSTVALNGGGAGNISVPNNANISLSLPGLGWSGTVNGAPLNEIGNNGQFQIFQAAFLAIDWQTNTGWHGKFDFVPWNDFCSYSGEGDGYPYHTSTFNSNPAQQTTLSAQHAAAAYLVLHLLCDSGTQGDPYGVCGNVVAGGFSSNAMNCTDHTNTTCSTGSTATLLDQYLYYIYSYAQTNPTGWTPNPYPYQISDHHFPSTWKPEVFAFKDFDDVSNYINNSGTSTGQCVDATTCVAKSVAKGIASDPFWSGAQVWNIATAAGRTGVTTTSLATTGNTSTNTKWQFTATSVADPDPTMQACAASYMLNLMSSLGPQYTRLYYEGAAWNANIAGSGPNGNWSLFPAGDAGTDAATAKPAFGVLASRNLAYVPPSGSTPAACPGGVATQVANISDPTNAGQTITGTGVFATPLVAQAQDVYGNPFGGVQVTFGPVSGLQFSTSASGTFSNTVTVMSSTAAGSVGNTPPVYTQAANVGTYTATATLAGAPGATPAQFGNLLVAAPTTNSTSALTVNNGLSASVKYGDTVTLVDTVSPAPAASEADTVTFWVSAVGTGTSLGTQTVAADGTARITASLHASTTPYTIIAQFNGGTNVSAGPSNTVQLTVNQLTLNNDGVTPVLIATPNPASRYANVLDSSAWDGYTLAPASGASFVNGDNASSVVIAGTPVYTSSAPNTQAPGTYAVTLTGISSPDYLIGFAPGTLVVNAGAPTLQQNADSFIIGFTGPIANTLPFADTFYQATSTYLQSKGLAAPKFRICEAYLTWDAAMYPAGTYGSITTVNSRAWFEDWLRQQQGHCDRALITFKNVNSDGSVTQSPTAPPAPSDYRTAMEAFLSTDWQSLTTWTGTFDFIPWNEPNNGAGSGDGYTSPLTANQAADLYLVMRSVCQEYPSKCGTVAAGAFASNGNMWQDYLQKCTDDTNAACATGSTASYLDKYKYYIYADLATYWPNAPAGFKPEAFAYHEWNDINNYILRNNTNNLTCTNPGYCTAKMVSALLSDPWWSNAEFWNSEVGLGQAGNPSPDNITQACAASYLLRVNTSSSPRFTRLYYMRAAESDGSIWSLFDNNQNPKPSFNVLANRNLTYVPPAGSTPAACNAGPQTQVVNQSDASNVGQTIASPGVFPTPLVAQAQDVYGDPMGSAGVTFGPVAGLKFSTSASGPWTDTVTANTGSSGAGNGNTPSVYVEATDKGTFTATATLVGVSSATPAQFQNLTVQGLTPPPPPPSSSLRISSSPNPPVAGQSATLSVALPAGATGTVTFTDQNSAALTCTNATNPATGTVTVAANGTVSCTTTIPSAATAVTGTYNADASSSYSSAALNSLAVGQPPLPPPSSSSLRISSSPNPPVAGQSATLSVALPVGATGTVTFTDQSGAALTCSNATNPTTGTVTVAADGTASCATTIPQAASAVTGKYNADARSSYSSAALSSVAVQSPGAANFALGTTSTTQTVALGAASSYTVNLSAVNGPYNCPVALLAAFSPTLPPAATWSFAQGSVTPGANGASTTLTVTVPSQTAVLDRNAGGFGAKGPLGLAALLLPLMAWRRRQKWGGLLMLIVLGLGGLVGSAAITGCGGSSVSTQSYQITITGTGSCGGSHSTTVSLVVSN